MHRSLEFTLLFLLLPVAFALLAWALGEGWFLLPGLWTLASSCMVILLRDPSFAREALFMLPEGDARAAQLRNAETVRSGRARDDGGHAVVRA